MSFKGLGIFAALWLLAAPLYAANVAEVFMMLPSQQCGGYNIAEREYMLKNVIAAPGSFGVPSVPDVGYPWVRLVSVDYLILERPGFANISYKLFQGRGNYQIVAISRGRTRNNPSDPVCALDLCLYRLDTLGLSPIDHSEVLPAISILDFISPDTLIDPGAARDIAARGPTYNQCLTSSLSVLDATRIDIMTSTSLNAAACNNFIPQYDLLPLKWGGSNFTKPYDRAAPKDAPF